MGTRWRGLLAPINKPTGDGRRMAKGSFTNRDLPLALKWQRVDDDGHDASVVIGLMDTLTIDEAAGEVWGEGEVFDDHPELPRMSEDVAEAMLLTSKKIIGPSVDAGAAEAILVEEGHDEPLTEERMDELWMEAMETGVDPPIEMLFTRYEIAAATLVVIPAFAEARPFELIVPDAEEETTPAPAAASLVASLTAAAAAPVLPADVFTDPGLSEYSPIHVVDRGEGFKRLVGLVAAGGVCHMQFQDACFTAPTSHVDYVPFHRFPQNTATGLVATGRITTGLGRVGTGCTHRQCRGKDDHACDDMTLAQTLSHYDRLNTVAYGRVGHTESGDIWFAGVARDDLTPDEAAVLARRRFSGDWRDVGGRLELVEVLALSVGKPAFPIPTITMRGGRQLSLTAAGAVHPDRPVQPRRTGLIDHGRLARDVADLVVAELRPPAPAVTAADAPVHTGAMIALRMTDDAAERIAVEGGEPADELHLTLAYLGEAADIPQATQDAIVEAMTAYAQGVDPVTGKAFAVSVFNPANDDMDTAIVLGLDGEEMAAVHAGVVETLTQVFVPPEQHAPWAAHITLQYSDDLALVEAYADRTDQEVPFDRIRVAFAGVATDIPFATSGAATEASRLAAEIDAAVDSVDADERSRAALALLAEIDQAVVHV